MGVQEIVEAIVSFVKEHQSWAIPVAFLVAFGESICFLSLVWPGTAILVGISALIAASGVEIGVLWPAIVSAGLGGAFGYALSYWIGWYFKASVPKIWPFSTHPQLIPRGEEFFEKYGAWGVFLGHFFGPVRAVIPVVAGMFRMRQLPFQIANIASAFIWAAGVIAPAFFLVTFKDQVFAFMRQYELVVVLAMLALAFLNSIPTPLFAVPSLVTFVGLGALHLYAGGQFAAVLAGGALGAWAGDLYAYYCGRSRLADFHLIWSDGWSEETATRARNFVIRWGVASLLPSKFHTMLRAFAPLAGGAVGLSIVPFAIVSALSSLVWAGVLLALRPLVGILLGW